MLAGCRDGRVGSEIAEVVGIRKALSWVKGKNWSKVLLESDYLVAVQAIRGTCYLPSSAAHCITRASYYLPECDLSILDVPPAFSSIVQSDLRS